MSVPKEFDKAHSALLFTHAGEIIGTAVKVASDAMETGFVTGWNAALTTVGTPEAHALIIRCEHGAALGVEECLGEQRGTVQ